MIKDFKLTKYQLNQMKNYRINLNKNKILQFNTVLSKSYVKRLLTKLRNNGLIIAYYDYEKIIKSSCYVYHKSIWRFNCKTLKHKKSKCFKLVTTEKTVYCLEYFSAFAKPEKTIDFNYPVFEKWSIPIQPYKKEIDNTLQAPEIKPLFGAYRQCQLDNKLTFDNYYKIQDMLFESRKAKYGYLDHYQYNDNLALSLRLNAAS